MLRLLFCVLLPSALLAAAAPFVERISPVHYLALAMYYEARGEGPFGQIAVGEVVLNRVAHKGFPNTIYKVVTQKRIIKNRPHCDFQFYCIRKNIDPWTEDASHQALWLTIKAEAFALWALDRMGYRTNLTGDSTFYRRFDDKSNWFARALARGKMRPEVVIGNHVFYRQS